MPPPAAAPGLRLTRDPHLEVTSRTSFLGSGEKFKTPGGEPNGRALQRDPARAHATPRCRPRLVALSAMARRRARPADYFFLPPFFSIFLSFAFTVLPGLLPWWLTNFTHWPWFLKDGFLNLRQPPFLHCCLLVGGSRT
jgi:hypothetical protein